MSRRLTPLAQRLNNKPASIHYEISAEGEPVMPLSKHKLFKPLKLELDTDHPDLYRHDVPPLVPPDYLREQADQDLLDEDVLGEVEISPTPAEAGSPEPRDVGTGFPGPDDETVVSSTTDFPLEPLNLSMSECGTPKAFAIPQKPITQLAISSGYEFSIQCEGGEYFEDADNNNNNNNNNNYDCDSRKRSGDSYSVDPGEGPSTGKSYDEETGVEARARLLGLMAVRRPQHRPVTPRARAQSPRTRPVSPILRSPTPQPASSDWGCGEQESQWGDSRETSWDTSEPDPPWGSPEPGPSRSSAEAGLSRSFGRGRGHTLWATSQPGPSRNSPEAGPSHSFGRGRGQFSWATSQPGPSHGIVQHSGTAFFRPKQSPTTSDFDSDEDLSDHDGRRTRSPSPIPHTPSPIDRSPSPIRRSPSPIRRSPSPVAGPSSWYPTGSVSRAVPYQSRPNRPPCTDVVIPPATKNFPLDIGRSHNNWKK